MGGDFAPGNVVAGALEALRESRHRFTVALVGPQERIEQELRQQPDLADLATVLHAPEVIEMHDSPTAALKAKKDSSISVGLRAHKEGRAHAFVSAGNTGAVLSASTLILGRLKGVGRPTIGALLPTEQSPCLLLDAGANVDCRARHLFEFAVMGSVYLHEILGIHRPRVGLLNIGEEQSKGTQVVVEAFGLLQKSGLKFIGNIEGRDILKGRADVAVCDGFVGNTLLKFGESIPAFLKARFTLYAAQSLRAKVIGLIARNSLRSVMKEMDYQEHGGVPILGVQGVSIIGHGGSTPKAIKNMVVRAEEMIRKQVHSRIQETLRDHYG
ncbi:MAG: phosphate acyltransferase PlsX [Bacteroidetes bacterium]|nr:phosphate acyltransferase PlsX [Bacteroidota bacterium]